jgi:hypothetical protein
MGELVAALLGFADLEHEKRYVAHLNSMIMPWFHQAYLGQAFALIALLQAEAKASWEWGALLVPALFLAVLCTTAAASSRLCSGPWVMSTVMANFAILRIVSTFDLFGMGAPTIRRFLISGEVPHPELSAVRPILPSCPAGRDEYLINVLYCCVILSIRVPTTMAWQGAARLVLEGCHAVFLSAMNQHLGLAINVPFRAACRFSLSMSVSLLMEITR